MSDALPSISLDVAAPGQPRYAVGELRCLDAVRLPSGLSIARLTVTEYRRPLPHPSAFALQLPLGAKDNGASCAGFVAYLRDRGKAGCVTLPGARDAVLVPRGRAPQLLLLLDPEVAAAPALPAAASPEPKRQKMTNGAHGPDAVDAAPASPPGRPPSPDTRPPSPSMPPPTPDNRPPSPQSPPPSPPPEPDVSYDEDPDFLDLPRIPLPERTLSETRFSAPALGADIFIDCPKGAIQHMHFSGYVRYAKLLDHLWASPHYRSRLRLNEAVPELYFEDRVGEDDRVIGDAIDVEDVRKRIEAAAQDFDVLGKLFYCVVKRIDFLQEYMVLMLQEMLEEHVAHVDLRLRLGSAFRLDARGRRQKVSMVEEVTLYRACFDHLFLPHQCSFSLIPCFSKKARPDRITAYFGEVEALRYGHPQTLGKLIGAYDLVGEEEPFQLRRFAHCLEGLPLPFYFHAGEIAEGVDNVAFALEHGGTRIGHGVHICGHPELIEKCHARRMVLEFCPVSNHRLSTVSDLGVYKKLLDQGILATISPDDPNKLGDGTMSDNLKLLRSEACGLSWADVHNCLRRSFDSALFPDPSLAPIFRRRFAASTCRWLRRHGAHLGEALPEVPDFCATDLLVTLDARSLVKDLKAGGMQPGAWSVLEVRHMTLRRLRRLQSEVFGQSRASLERYFGDAVRETATMMLYAPQGVVAVPAVGPQEALTMVGVVLEDFTDVEVAPEETLAAAYSRETKHLRRATLFFIKAACLGHFRLSISRPCLFLAYVT